MHSNKLQTIKHVQVSKFGGDSSTWLMSTIRQFVREADEVGMKDSTKVVIGGILLGQAIQATETEEVDIDVNVQVVPKRTANDGEAKVPNLPVSSEAPDPS